MANTLQLGNGKWATGTNTVLAFNDENNNFKPLPFDFSRASSATVVNQSGLIETVGSGEPRIDFKDNTKGALLLEPQRSNLFTYSEDFSQSYWNKNSASVTLTSKIAPNGTLNSVYNLVGTAANLWSAGTIGTQHTISFYIKSNGQGKDKFRLRLGNNTSIEYTATNEWVRFEYSETPTTSVYSITTSSAPNDEYDLLVWGGQSEVGSYATSYIPTSGSAVTRVVDSCLQGGFQDKNIFGSTQGSAVFELKWDIGAYVFDFSDASGIRLRIFDGGSNWKIRDYGNGSWVNTNFSKTNNVKTKIGFKWNGTQFTSFQDGVKSSSTDSFASSMAIESITTNKLNNTSDMQFYNTALTDQELIALTTI